MVRVKTAKRHRTGRTPRTPALAGRLVEIVRDDGGPRSPRRPDCSLRCPGSPPSSRHSAAPPSCRAWMPGSRTRAEARQANIGRMPMVRVKTEPALVLRRCTAPRRRTIAWHDAMPSTSGRRPAKRKRQDAVFVVKTSTVFVVKTSAVFVVKTSAVFVVHQSGGGASVSKWARRIAEKSVPEPSAYRRRAESGAVWPSRRTSAR